MWISDLFGCQKVINIDCKCFKSIMRFLLSTKAKVTANIQSVAMIACKIRTLSWLTCSKYSENYMTALLS